MEKNYKRIMELIIADEGGDKFTNHAWDNGGPTKYGVIQRVYDAHRRTAGQQMRSVAMCTFDEAAEIYRTRYWNLIQGWALPSGVDYIVMDGAVNSGVAQSTKWLQRAIGAKDDGEMGPVTIDRSDDQPAPVIIDKIVDLRIGMLKGLDDWGVAGPGWMNRVLGDMDKKTGKRMTNGVVHNAKRLAAADTSTPVIKPPVPVVEVKAVPKGAPLRNNPMIVIVGAIIGGLIWVISKLF